MRPSFMFIELNETSKISEQSPRPKSGHEAYWVTYSVDQNKEPLDLYYKKNKYGKPINSKFEVAFSGLANLFLKPGLTANQYIVKQNDAVCGVAAEHICYAIERHSPQNEKTFYSFSYGKSLSFEAHDVQNSKKIPFYLMDKLESGYFCKLCQFKDQGFITFNMVSLASVLSTSYTLEEDDLHKGNFGFYLVADPKSGKPEAIFFKIDHDLMLSDSVMSRGSARFANLLYSDRAFEVTPRDLMTFPLLKDSGNHYWPTRFALFAKHPSNQTYTQREIKAITKLNKDQTFQQAKWLSFYKHILVPPAEIQQAVAAGYDAETAEGQSHIALVTNAVVARQARLRAVLFSLPEFRDFVAKIDKKLEEDIINEIIQPGAVREGCQDELKQSMAYYKLLCKENCFAKGDTPLHVAIRLGDYRYDETWSSFGFAANKRNDKGQRPIDIAIEQFRNQQINEAAIPDVRKNYCYIIKDLIQHGSHKSKSYKSIKMQVDELTSVHWGKQYLQQVYAARDCGHLLELFRSLSADCRLTLKMKKELSLRCLREYISAAQQREDPLLEIQLRDLKVALNGDTRRKPDPTLQFICQLRSRLWIVRQWRGLWGGSSTKGEFNKIIDKALSNYNYSNCFGTFFGGKRGRITQVPQITDGNPLVIAKVDGEPDKRENDHAGALISPF